MVIFYIHLFLLHFLGIGTAINALVSCTNSTELISHLFVCLLSLTDHMCDTPPVLTNGQIIFSNDTTSPYEFGTVATYVCDTGFSLIGETTRTCDGDDSSPIGMWTGNDPSCSGM